MFNVFCLIVILNDNIQCLYTFSTYTCYDQHCTCMLYTVLSNIISYISNIISYMSNIIYVKYHIIYFKYHIIYFKYHNIYFPIDHLVIYKRNLTLLLIVSVYWQIDIYNIPLVICSIWKDDQYITVYITNNVINAILKQKD